MNAIRQTLSPSIEQTPSTYTECPECGTTVVNAQGVSACIDCDWIRHH